MPDPEWGSDPLIYEVVRNTEGQYSMHPQGRALPAGWSLVGRSGSEDECAEYIESVWTDMTPASVARVEELSEPR